jgi:hypothetical protein
VDDVIRRRVDGIEASNGFYKQSTGIGRQLQI